MQEYGTDAIRNVAVIGHGGTGKTSLAEAILFKSGAISRLGRVDDGTTTGDYDPDEQKRTMTINLSLLPVERRGHKITIIDTPGYPDFVGEALAGLAAADSALVVVDAAAGVQVGTLNAWELADARALPRLVLVNRMDRENADFDAAVASLRQAFGQRCAPLQVPIGAHEGFDGVVDLLHMKAYTGPDGAEGPVPDDLADVVASYREQLIEAVAETDDDLIAKYLEGEQITDDELAPALRRGACSGNVVPILVGSASKTIGVPALLDAIVELLPSPRDARPIESEAGGITADPNGSPVAWVFKTTADPYVGRLTYFRVVSGTVTADSHLWNANKGKDERLGQIFVMRGKQQEPIAKLAAGDIGAVAKLSETGTGDTLCAKDGAVRLAPIALPKPVLSVAVSPKTKADLDKLGGALARIVEEDPTLAVRRDPDTHETILSGVGETQLDVAAERMRRKFGVEVEVHMPKVAYKETVRGKAEAEYKHKKQTGGHGQYGHVFLRVEPLPRGSGFQFAEEVVGGSVPRNFIPAVEKGVVESLPGGVAANCPLVDLRVTLFDGSSHPVDSSEMAFKLAASQALRKGVERAGPVILEPIVALHIRVPDEFVGDVVSDLNTRRAHVLGMWPGGAVTTIEATAPLAEVLRYATDLRSLTQGRGSFQSEMDRYEDIPEQLAQKIIKAAQEAG